MGFDGRKRRDRAIELNERVLKVGGEGDILQCRKAWDAELRDIDISKWVDLVHSRHGTGYGGVCTGNIILD